MKKTIWVLIMIIMITNVLSIMPVLASEKLVIHKTFEDESVISEWLINTTSIGNVKIEDNAFIVENISSKPFTEDGGNNGTMSASCYALFNALLDKDEENDTTVTTNTLTGKLAVEMDFELYIDTERDLATRFAVMFGYKESLTSTFSMFGDLRLNNSASFSNRKDSSSNYPNGYIDSLTFDTHHTMRIEIDMNERTFTSKVDNGDFSDPYPFTYNAGFNKIFNSIRIVGMEASTADSYFKLKRFDVYKLDSGEQDERETALNEALSELPEKLVDDINAVTENIDLPQSVGGMDIVWLSSDESTISSTGIVYRSSVDKNVTLSAMLSYSGNEEDALVYLKNYNMTVLYSEEVPPQEEKLIFDETYTSYNELTGWKFTHDDHTASYVEDNSLIIKQLKTTPNNPDGSGNSTYSFYASKDFTGLLEKDEENNTEIIATEFSGKYALEFDMEYYIDTERSNKTIYFLYLGYRANKDAEARTITESMIEIRLGNKTLSVYHMTPSGSKQNMLSEPCSIGAPLKLKIVFDTRTKLFDIHKNGELVGYNIPFIYDKGQENVFSSIRLDGLQANSLDSYLQINGIKLYRLEADLTDERYINAVNAFNLLPDSLVADPSYVIDNIEIPNINEDLNVRWASGNTQAISNDGIVNRWVDDIDTYIQASFSATSPTKSLPFNYVKRYNVRVPAIEGVETKTLMNEMYSMNEELNDWRFDSFYEEIDGQYKIDNDELVFEKISDKDDTIFYDLKSFYGIKTFYGEDNEYVTESNSKLFSDSFSGIYDISITSIPKITGDKPAIVEIGYYDDVNNRYSTFGAIRFTKSLVSFITETEDELENNAVISDDEVSNKEFDLKIRIDTDSKKIWLYSNDIMITEQNGFSYYDSEDVNCFNALRVSLDKNMNFGDLFKIKNIILEQKLPKSIEGKEQVYNSAELLDISVISDTPDNVVNNIKPLPSIIGNAQVIWETSDKNIIDIQTGKVYRADKDMNITLRAKIIVEQVYVYKEFYLTVPKTENPTELLEYYANKLDILNVTKQDINNIRYDIDLPVSFDGGTTITWISSDTSIMGNDGRLNLNSLIEDNANVNLTATIEDDFGNSKTKSFSINVRGRGSNVNIYNEDINDLITEDLTIKLDDIDNCVITSDTFINMTVSKENCSSGELYVKDSEGEIGFLLNIKDNDLKYKDVHLATIPDNEDFNLKLLLMPDDNRLALWINGVLKLDNENTFSAIDNFYSVGSNTTAITLKNISVDVDEYGVLQINLDNIDYFSVFDNNYIKNSLILNTDSILQTKVEWSSDNTEILDDNGTLYIPDYHTFVNMNFKISGLNGNKVSFLKTINFVVPCDTSKNLAIGKQFTGSAFEDLAHPIANINDGDISTYYLANDNTGSPIYITVEMGGSSYINYIYLNEVEDSIKKYTIEYSDDGSKWHEVKNGNITNIQSRLINFNPIKPKYLKFNIIEREKSSVIISELELYLFTDEADMAELDINGISLDYNYVLTSDITLPVTGMYGTQILWSSSHEDILSKNGVMTKPKHDTEVTLTAYTIYDGQRFEKKFKFYVKGTSGGEGGTIIGRGSGSGGSAMPSFPQQRSTIDNIEETKPLEIFNDVSQNMWFYNDVKKLKEAGIIAGDGENNFNPNDSITREQFLKMIIIAAEIDNQIEDNNFMDVVSSAWYADYVLTAKAHSIINGISETIFGIGENIIRQDMAVIIKRVLDYKEIQTERTEIELFKDNNEISDYANKAVYDIKAMGIVKGYDNMFAPKDTLTRAEAATVISALLDLI